MTDRLRAVFDTNVFVSAFLSRSPSSPTKELLERWQADEFTLLISDDLLDEIAEKLLERGIEGEVVSEFLTLLAELAESIEVAAESVLPVVLDDPDDDPIVACAVLGKADYLVTYDVHFEPLNGEHSGIKIVKALPFLWTLRGDRPAEP